MDKITVKMRQIARQALANGEVNIILGWKKGDAWHDSYPAFIKNMNETETLVWDSFCINNLSKYLINELNNNEKIGVFLKGCDSRAFNQLVADNRVVADRVVIYGLPCPGMIDPAKVKQAGLNKGLLAVKRSGDQLTFVTKNGEKEYTGRNFDYDKCLECRYPNPVVYNRLLSDPVIRTNNEDQRFSDVAAIEEMPLQERYDYWVKQFSKCIRCYACRNICPACSCETCIFDNTAAGVASKADVDCEQQFFHIIRAYHVAGRCVDCGECSRVCPAGIPLQKLNRKIIKDINELYGKYEAGAGNDQATPLGSYKIDDSDPFAGHRQGGK